MSATLFTVIVQDEDAREELLGMLESMREMQHAVSWGVWQRDERGQPRVTDAPKTLRPPLHHGLL